MLHPEKITQTINSKDKEFMARLKSKETYFTE